MNTVLIKFKILLKSDLAEHGPLFHRWLPNGEDNALLLETGHSDTILRVWFERSGFVDKGNIIFDEKRQEVDPEVMRQQGVLEAGPLIGLLRINDVSPEEFQVLAESQDRDKTYVSFVKKIVNRLIYPAVSNLINILRTNYGQYWLKKLDRWDSQKESLDSYSSSHFHIQISLDDGKSWGELFPRYFVELKISATIIQQKTLTKYLTEADWDNIQDLITQKYSPSYATMILSRAYQLHDQGDLKQSIVEGVTALEIAISEFMNQRITKYAAKNDLNKSFFSLSLPGQITTIATIMNNISPKELDETLKLIAVRNSIVHEGLEPGEKERRSMMQLLNLIAKLLIGPDFRFLYANIKSPMRLPAEQWDEIMREKIGDG